MALHNAVLVIFYSKRYTCISNITQNVQSENEHTMNRIHYYLFLVSLLTFSSCLDDLETDKIEFSSVEISPSLMLPLAKADVTVQYLFDSYENAVEYFTDTDGYQKIRFSANHDSIISYSVLDNIGLSEEKLTFTGSKDMSKAVDFSLLTPLESEAEVSYPLSIDIPLNTLDGDIESIDCDYELTLSWSGFSHVSVLVASFAGQEKSFSLNGSGSGTMSASNVTINATDGNLPITFDFRANPPHSGSWGSISYSLRILNVDKLRISNAHFVFPTESYISLAALSEFQRIMHNVTFRNPDLWITADNATDLNCVLQPTISNADNMSSDAEANNTARLDNIKLYVPARDNVEQHFDNEQISPLIQSSPDSLLFVSDVALSTSSVATISRTDSLFIGYGYLVPFEFKIDGEVSGDTVSFNDLPELSNIDKAKLIVTCTNGFPVGGSLIIQLLDKNTEKRLSTIVATNVIPSPTINSDGISQDTKTNTVTVELSSQNIEDLDNTGSLIISFIMTSNNKWITPTLGNKLQIDIALAAIAKFEH